MLDDFVTIKDKIERYSKDEHSKFYQLNFCVYAMPNCRTDSRNGISVS